MALFTQLAFFIPPVAMGAVAMVRLTYIQRQARIALLLRVVPGLSRQTARRLVR
jgi:hypothetical protein